MRDSLVALLHAHVPADPREAQHKDTMLAAARTLAAPLSRHEASAHFTASAVVVDAARVRVCFVHHKKVGRWLQPGGHVEDTDADLAAAALREVREETGLHASLASAAPIDLDAHVIHARMRADGTSEPEHVHLDVRFLVVAHDPESLAHQADEANAARWFSWDEALALAAGPGGDAALVRLLGKARA